MFSPPKTFNKENVLKTSNNGGLYMFFDKNGNQLYVGRTSGNMGGQWGDEPHERYQYGMRHRLQSYYQKDDYKVHNEKKEWRGKIAYFSYSYESDEATRRNLEKKLKPNSRYNKC